MQSDLGLKVQRIADAFFKDHRNTNNFNNFYNAMLPEANRMLQCYLRDPAKIDDIASKIFENILLKPPIYKVGTLEQEFCDIASMYYGTAAKHFIYKVTSEENPKKFSTRSYYSSIDENVKVTTLSYTEVGKLWSILNRTNEYKVIIKVKAVTKDGKYEVQELDGSKFDDMINTFDKVVPVIEYLGLNPDKIEEAINTKKQSTKLRRIHELFKMIDLAKLAKCPSPFIFDPDKPFLHYFSRVIKTNALSLLKKNGKYQEISESEQFGNFDDDDRSQLISNQLTDERIKSEVEQYEDSRKLTLQKYLIIYDVIQNHFYHENDKKLREVMVDAIIFNKDYNEIASKVDWKVEHGKYANKKELATGKIKSRVHRFSKLLKAEIAKTPQFTRGCNINLDMFHTYYSDGQLHMTVEICETELDGGGFHTLWHGHYIRYYSTGEVKEIGRYYLDARQGQWWEYYKNGEVMKRGKYLMGKKVGRWHHFCDDGEVDETLNYQDGEETYYEIRNKVNKWKYNITAGNPGNPITIKLKKSDDETTAEKLCIKYDDELPYSPVHISI